MKNTRIRITALLLLLGLTSSSIFGVYGLTSTKSAGQIDAIASASKSTSKPKTQTPSKPTAAPKTAPIPVPVQVPISVPVIPEVTVTSHNLIVLGKTVDLTGTPMILTPDRQVMLPLRKLAEALGYTVTWDQSIKAAVLQNNGESVIVNSGNVNYLRGSQFRVFKTKPEISNSTFYVPLEFITENPAYQVNQTTTAITLELSNAPLLQTATGYIDSLQVFTNGLSVTLSRENESSLLLYITDSTLITDSSTSATLDRSSLRAGMKAQFEYVAVSGQGTDTYRVVNRAVILEPAPISEITSRSPGDDGDEEDDDEDDHDDEEDDD